MTFLDTAIIVGVIAAVATVLSASLPNYLTKRNDLNAKIKDLKLTRYYDLSLKLTEYISNLDDNNAGHQFVAAYNQATGYADLSVIKACDSFLSSLYGYSTAGWDVNKANDAIREIFRAMRKDINPKAPESKFEIFSVPEKKYSSLEDDVKELKKDVKSLSTRFEADLLARNLLEKLGKPEEPNND